MQITKAEVIPVELKLRHPVQMAGSPAIQQVTAIFVRLETRQGVSAWGCTVAERQLTGENPADVLRACRQCATITPDLNPLNLEYSLDELARQVNPSAGAMCAFDLALHDLLSLAADLPLYRLLGGYRNRIQTSVTIPISPVDETVDAARRRASQGFRILKIKGGLDPEEDVRRVKALHAALPEHTLRLDSDGGYTVQQALDVARALEDVLEMLEQPTAADDLAGLRQIKEISPVRILADQSLAGPRSALELASNRIVDGLSIKLAACGGIRNARLIDSIARAARLTSMVSCFIEPTLLVSAGLSLALSSPNVAYGDLDGHLELVDDPSQAGFSLEEGWLIAPEVAGLGFVQQPA
jgi:L-alanine-DL-glutamate epimerase-like enolase superfamily enzyme